MADRPATGTREWAEVNRNCISGCAHGCKYCYAWANAARFDRLPPGGWTEEVVNIGKVEKGYGKCRGRVMFPTTHDITPENSHHTFKVLEKMLKAGNEVLVVSKPHLSVIQHFCARLVNYKDKILFRFSIGAGEPEPLALWEPGAPNFAERLQALGHAYNEGFQTSVSMEPLLETNEDRTVELVGILALFVTDSIWIGKMNHARARLSFNGFGADEEMMAAARELEASQSDDRIRELYARLADHPVVKWKESIKKVVGIEVSTTPGLDQ